MQIPVLIAARDEAEYISRTLAAMDRRTVDPYVITNDSHDATAAIAREKGAHVFELDAPGKLPAIQYGLRKLGRGALGPVLYTDADTHPLYPSRWAGAMTGSLSHENRVACGLYIADEGNFASRAAMSALRIANVMARFVRRQPHATGANMATLIEDEETLDRVMALGNVWPKDDLKLANTIDGNRPHKIVMSHSAWVVTSSRYLPSVTDLIKHGIKGSRKLTDQNRARRAVPGSIPYESE